MNLEDKVAVPWMAEHTRNPTPDLIVWRQDDVTHSRFYWLAVGKEHIKARALIRARHDGQTFTIEHSDVAQLLIRVNDDMIDFNKKVTVVYNGQVLFKDKLSRSASTIQRTFQERHDVHSTFSAEIEINIPQS